MNNTTGLGRKYNYMHTQKNDSGKFSAYTQTYKAQRIRGAKSEEFETPQGIKQGDNLSPLLFITIMDQILKQCQEKKGEDSDWILEHATSVHSGISVGQ
jgi:hypothetical protein